MLARVWAVKKDQAHVTKRKSEKTELLDQRATFVIFLVKT